MWGEIELAESISKSEILEGFKPITKKIAHTDDLTQVIQVLNTVDTLLKNPVIQGMVSRFIPSLQSQQLQQGDPSKYEQPPNPIKIPPKEPPKETSGPNEVFDKIMMGLKALNLAGYGDLTIDQFSAAIEKDAEKVKTLIAKASA